MLASALVDLAQYALEKGESHPVPDPGCSDVEADLEGPIYLHLNASTKIHIVPEGVTVP